MQTDRNRRIVTGAGLMALVVAIVAVGQAAAQAAAPTAPYVAPVPPPPAPPPPPRVPPPVSPIATTSVPPSVPAPPAPPAVPAPPTPPERLGAEDRAEIRAAIAEAQREAMRDAAEARREALAAAAEARATASAERDRMRRDLPARIAATMAETRRTMAAQCAAKGVTMPAGADIGALATCGQDVRREVRTALTDARASVAGAKGMTESDRAAALAAIDRAMARVGSMRGPGLQ